MPHPHLSKLPITGPATSFGDTIPQNHHCHCCYHISPWQPCKHRRIKLVRLRWIKRQRVREIQIPLNQQQHTYSLQDALNEDPAQKPDLFPPFSRWIMGCIRCPSSSSASHFSSFLLHLSLSLVSISSFAMWDSYENGSSAYEVTQV